MHMHLQGWETFNWLIFSLLQSKLQAKNELPTYKDLNQTGTKFEGIDFASEKIWHSTLHQ